MSQTLFQMIDAAVKGGSKVQARVRELVNAGAYAGIEECAQQIEARYPVKKDSEGKDANKDARNDRLRALRMALMRAGREIDKRLRIKKVEGEWQVIEDDEAKPAAKAKEAEASDAEAEAEAESEKLWQAVELVLANLGNAAVLSAIRSGLEQLARM